MIDRRATTFRKCALQRLESRQLLAGDLEFCVPAEPPFPAAALSGSPLPNTPAISTPAAGAPAAGTLAVGHAPYDPSGDGAVNSLDALQVLTFLANVERGREQLDAASLRRFDVNQDAQVTPLDALRVITAIAGASRAGFAELTVPQASLAGPSVGSAVNELSIRLELARQVDAVFAAIGNGAAATGAKEISRFRQGDVLALEHEDVLELFGPIADGPVEFEFWTDDPQRTVRTYLSVQYQAARSGSLPLPAAWTENAEHGSRNVIDQTDASYALVQSAVVAEGTRAFHLAQPRGTANWFELDRDLPVQRDTKLFFMSRLGWAMPGQTAAVEVSTDGGVTWPHTVHSQAGSGDAGEAGFTLRQVELSQFAGQQIRIRFSYRLESGAYFPQSDAGIGWYVDKIQIGNHFEKQRYEIGDPSAEEQLFLEYVNRARADAVAEAIHLAGETDPQIVGVYTALGIDPRDIVGQYTAQVNAGTLPRHAPPLSFHRALLQAAELHSQDLLANRFQGHLSSAKAPQPFQPGFTATRRAAALGYSGGVGENVFAYARSVAYGHAAFAVDWGPDSPQDPGYNPLFAGQGMQNPAGHRLNLHNPRYKEFGVGVIHGSSGSIGPQVVTQNFGIAGDMTYITGVVYEDLNGNDFYDVGEGREGVRVDIDGSGYYAISAAAGGYSVPVTGDGRYSVTFSGGGYASEVVTAEVVNAASVKVDYRV